jgi:DNA-binding transcriptional ArsR family regulator
VQELHLTSGTVSVRLERLTEQGLVERRLDRRDRRTVRVSLTERGSALFQAAVSAHLANQRRLLASLTDDEQDQLTELLRKLVVEFEGAQPSDDVPPRLGLVVVPAHVAIRMRRAVGLPERVGLLVRSVEPDGTAAAADLLPGDVLVAAGTCELRSIASLHAAIARAARSGQLELRVVRGVEERSVTVRLGREPRPAPTRPAARRRRDEHLL